MSKYRVGQVLEHKGFQVQVYAIGEVMTAFGEQYRMIGIQYLNGIRSAIKEEIKDTKMRTYPEATMMLRFSNQPSMPFLAPTWCLVLGDKILAVYNLGHISTLVMGWSNRCVCPHYKNRQQA